ncbi:response regulator [Novosphingobium bradum]|uniref:Response regulator n=2 Tax=Novosphingobium bradum TaxID=1737444 RepID=A0ABV7IV92_9SPHN
MRRDPPVRLLVVDDDAEAAAELAELFEAHGAVVSLAQDAAEALRLVVEARPEIALVDLQLGAASGAELALGWHGTAGAPLVLLLSGRALTAAEAAAFGADAPPLLRKPIDLARLVAEVDRLRP